MAKPPNRTQPAVHYADCHELARAIVLSNWESWGLRGNHVDVFGKLVTAPGYRFDRWRHEPIGRVIATGNLTSHGFPGGIDIGGWGPKPNDEDDMVPVRGGDAPPPGKSRPFAQFIAQVYHERVRVQREANSQPTHPRHLKDYSPVGHEARVAEWDAATEAYLARLPGGIPTPPDIYSICVERVRAAWKRWGVWHEKWGLMPGMQWQHERPLEEYLRDHGLGEYPGPEAGDLPQTEDVTEGQPEDVTQSQPEDVTQSQPEGQTKQPTPVPARRGQQDATRSLSESDADPSGISRAALGPIRPARVSKTGGHKRPNRALEAAAEVGLLEREVEIVDESQVPDSSRRSKRLLAAADREVDGAE